MEEIHKQFPFPKLLKLMLNCLKAIENEKEALVTKCRDYNVMDSFRSFDIDGRGYINITELTSGLIDS
jgi:Ca2+-binding EF-hand superfamily protein